jgi:ankyrin repeat protein
MEPDYSLIDAVESGDIETVATWLDLNPSILQQPKWAARLTSSAIGQDRAAVSRLLLERGIDVNSCLRGGTLLHIAASGCHPDSVRLLLSLGADASLLDVDGLPPLYYAALRHMDNDIVRSLAEKTTPMDLNTAVVLGDIDLLRELLIRSVDGVQQAPQPAKLLKDAIWMQNSPPLFNVEGMPPSPSARPAAEIVGLLLKFGADPNQGWRNHLPPLFEALSASNFDPRIVGSLIKSGADICKPNQNGESVLEYAQSAASPEAVALIKQAYRRRGIVPPKRE